MNKLAYGILSFVSIESLTGYDLMLKLKRFWYASHSNIYPLLSEMEQSEYLTLEVVEQSGKPDKKVYAITNKGKEILLEWINTPTSPAVTKDEMMLKMVCLEILDKETALKILDEAEGRYTNQINQYNEYLNKYFNLIDEDNLSANHRKFGPFILLKKAEKEAEAGLEWIQWVKKFYT